MSAAIRHVSVRVPWHDRVWDGHVCDAPTANASCLALKLIAEARDDAVELALAGEAIDELPFDKAPPCIKASGGFLAGRPQTFQSVMSYSRWSESHRHMKPKTLHLPAFGAQLIPYRWMLRESGFPLAEELELDVRPDQEPSEPEFLQNTAWVQHHDHQRALLEAFAEPLIEGQSLVLFYATRTPLCDDERRVLLGAALLEKKHGIFEYDYEPTAASPDHRLRAMVWERSVQHSLRPIPKDGEATRFVGGFLLPYHDVLRAAEAGADINPSDFVAFAPEDARVQFSYGSEQVSHGPAAAALLAARTSFERISQALDGPWAEQIAWIDEQLSRLWKLQGPAPGLGVALSVLHKGFNGTLFAIALADQLAPGEDPWIKADAVLSGVAPPLQSAPAITSTLTKRWAKLRADPGKLDAIKLLARFELSKDQAQRAWDEIESAEMLANPYLLYERDRDSLDPIAFATIDRGLLPGREVAEAHPLPASCPKVLSEFDNEHRLRAAAVHLLERASDEGHTLLTAARLADAAEELALTYPLPFEADILDLYREEFAPVVEVSLGDDPTAQLARYVDYRELIEKAVKDRLGTATNVATPDWPALLESKFGGAARNDEVEEAARREKATALERLAAHRIATLIGPAGTGKTAVLELLLQHPSIVGPHVLLLAPTGKARVRLGAATRRPGEAKTIAQFLLPLDRYDADTGRYAPAPHTGPAEASCCVIDEASMLTEDMLAAVLDALPSNCRLILVGDPYQLPPIGAGCPFVDIIAFLAKQHPECVAELSVSMRQRGDRSDGRLASVFSGRPLPAAEDEIAALALDGVDDAQLRLRQWNKVGELPALLRQVFEEEFGNGDLVAELEKTLGASANGEYLNFNRGCSDKAEAWQILSVNRNQAGGSVYLNRHIKETYRHERLQEAVASNQVDPRRWWFRTIQPQGPDQITYGDKVICVRNHQRKAWVNGSGLTEERDYLANGEIGLVTGLRAKRTGKPKFVQVEFTGRPDRSFSFSRSDFRDDGQPYLELAYAVTVHKAQGSQFGVVMLVLPAGSRLLSREMVYTALTRQTERVWILHQGGFENVLAYRHEAFSDVGARTTNLLRRSKPQRAILPPDLPPGVARNARGFLEERLSHRTIRGELVSSKAELAIANILWALEREKRLTYEVEPSLPFTDTAKGRWADFRIVSGGETWFWEHCGMLDREAYRQRWARKLKLYEENGFHPWSPTAPDGRLIVTEDGGGVGLDSQKIDQLARSLFR